MTPLAIDLFCGLGGWTEGFLAEGYNVVGFDIKARPYPGQLVLQNVLTLHGAQFRDATVIVASPPCTEYSYMAMPWSRGKQIAAALRGQGAFPAEYTGSRTIAELNALFDACFRIQRESCEASGRYIPMVVENVKGAQPWVGRAKANYGSFYLWGDVESVGGRIVRSGQVEFGMASVRASGRCQKVPGFRFDGSGGSFQTASVNATKDDGVKAGDRNPDGNGWSHSFANSLTQHGYLQDFKDDGTWDLVPATKNNGGSWFAQAHNTESGHGQNPDGRKLPGLNSWSGHGEPGYKPQGFNVTAAQRYREGAKGYEGGLGRGHGRDPASRHNSRSDSRKSASALIAKIPFPLAQHIARVFKP